MLFSITGFIPFIVMFFVSTAPNRLKYSLMISTAAGEYSTFGASVFTSWLSSAFTASRA